MLSFGPKKDLEKRPDQEPKFSMKNKTDKFIVLFAIIASVICLVLVGVLVFLYYHQ